jgi:hypothetical protein
MEHFYRAQQNLSSLHKVGWRPAEKITHFLNMRVLDLDFYETPSNQSRKWDGLALWIIGGVGEGRLACCP